MGVLSLLSIISVLIFCVPRAITLDEADPKELKLDEISDDAANEVTGRHSPSFRNFDSDPFKGIPYDGTRSSSGGGSPANPKYTPGYVPARPRPAQYFIPAPDYMDDNSVGPRPNIRGLGSNVRFNSDPSESYDYRDYPTGGQVLSDYPSQNYVHAGGPRNYDPYYDASSGQRVHQSQPLPHRSVPANYNPTGTPDNPYQFSSHGYAGLRSYVPTNIHSNRPVYGVRPRSNTGGNDSDTFATDDDTESSTLESQADSFLSFVDILDHALESSPLTHFSHEGRNARNKTAESDGSHEPDSEEAQSSLDDPAHRLERATDEDALMLFNPHIYMLDGEKLNTHNVTVKSMILKYLETADSAEPVIMNDLEAGMVMTTDGEAFTIINYVPDPSLRTNDFERCIDMDDAPVVVVPCGSAYLYPGYRYKFYYNWSKCRWRLRSAVASITLNFGSGADEERTIIHAMEQSIPYRASKDEILEVSHKEISLLLADADPDPANLDIEACIPGNHSVAAVYGSLGPCCVHRNATCGLKNNTLIPGLPFNSSEPVKSGTYPWQALLLVKPELSNALRAPDACAGALVAPRWVLTTASCFFPSWHVAGKTSKERRMPVVAVHFGVSHLYHTATSKRFFAEEIFLYPALSWTHDIALVRLSESPGLDPVCLPLFKEPNLNEDFMDVNGLVVGWTLSNDTKLPQQMWAIEEALVSGDNCAIQREEHLPPHTLCTIVNPLKKCMSASLLYDARGKNLVLRGLIAKHEVCDPSGLSVFTSVAHFIPWINSIISA
ncbi:uncharacterized protein LOC108668335 [Hyalella azteca]|uniref:Uncharacterized protein LOC108668335 n=1 Tax=Hyalella azteca TaxID=294128 RepID=A0A979FSG2_HYAAZ|nr:uncharacterized protein LOC108668335 [Hyalella azteca]